jgi:hypothetical protein
MSSAKETYVVSSTQLGKTEASAGGWCHRMAFSRPGSRGWWAAPTYRQAYGGWETFVQRGLEAGWIADHVESQLWAMTKNGSTFECRSWEKPNNLMGPAVDWCVVEEASLLTKRAHGIISSRRSATLGPILYIGNADHVGSEFYRLCKRAEAEQDAGNPRVLFRKWTWRDRAAALSDDERREYLDFLDQEGGVIGPDGVRRGGRLSAEDFNRLYEAEFLKLGAGLIDLSAVCVNGGDAANPVALPYAEPWFAEGEEDALVREQHDLACGEPCIGGMDLGDKQTYTVPVVFGRKTRRLRAMERFRHLGWSASAARATAIFARYGLLHPDTGRPVRSIPVFFDATGVGSAVHEELRKASIGTPVRYRPVTFNQDNKQDMVSVLQVATESETISMPYVAEAVEECETLERVALTRGVRYQAPPGGTSDIVWSLGLAVHGMTQIVSGSLA